MRFREIRETREVREIRKSEKSAFENLRESGELLNQGVFIPDPDTKPGGKYWNLAKAELGISDSDEELSGLEYAHIAKRILDIKKAERDAKIQAAIKDRQPEMPKLREVEKDLSNEGVLRAEIQAQQSQQAQAQQQSYEDKYKAAMQAAQELASSGYYTLEQAIQIVMANL